MIKRTMVFLILFLLVPFGIFASVNYSSDKTERNFRFDLNLTYNLGEISSQSIQEIRKARRDDPFDKSLELALGLKILKQVTTELFPSGEISINQARRLANNSKQNFRKYPLLVEAEGCLNNLLETDSTDYPYAYYLRGILNLINDDIPGSLADFYNAVNRKAGGSQAAEGAYLSLLLMWDNLSVSQRSQWSEQVAGKMVERIAETRSVVSTDYVLVSDLFFRSGDYDKALIVAEKGLDTELDNPLLLGIRSEVVDRLSLPDETKVEVDNFDSNRPK